MRAYSVMAWLLVLALLAACGDDSGGGGVGTAPDLMTDRDGGGDGDNGDGDGDGDAEPWVAPCEAPDGIVGGCGVCEELIFDLAMTDDTPRTLPLGMNRVKSRAGFVHVGESSGCVDALYVADVDGDAFMAEQPEAVNAIDNCHLFSEPAIAHAQDEAWLLAFVSNEDGNHVRAQVFDAEGELSNDGFRLSEDAVRPANVAVTVVGDNRRMVAWTEGIGQGTTVYARPVDGTGEPLGDVQTVANFPESVGSMALAQLGKEADDHEPSGAVITLWRLGVDVSEIVVIPLDLEGVPKAGERIVRNNAGDAANVAVAYNDRHAVGADLSAAAIAYTVSQSGGQQMWFELLDNDANIGPLWDNTGRALGPSAPNRVINSPARATGVSVARYAQGYIVIYRAMPGGLLNEPKIRAVLLNRTGGFIVDSDVAYTTEFGGPTAVVTGSDGRMFAAWSEISGSGIATYKVVRLPCPMQPR